MAQAVGPNITLPQLAVVIDDFTQAYAAGDATAFAALFTDDAQTTDGNGRNAIYVDYSDFFAQTVSRQMTLRNFTWRNVTENGRLGSGRFRITTVAADGEASIVEVDITLEATRQGEALLIKRMYYQ